MSEGNRGRLAGRLAERVRADGAIEDACASRVPESALLVELLRAEPSLPAVRDEVIAYLRQARPDDEGSRILREAALGRPDVRRAKSFCTAFEHGTGERKQRLLRTAFALFGLVPFDDEPGVEYRGQAVWTELSLCASNILHDHAHGRTNLVDQAFLVSRLAAAPPARVWQGNVLAHLIALHALHTFQAHGPLMASGATAVAGARRADGGVQFVTSQDVFNTAMAGTALSAAGQAPELVGRMADWVAERQWADGGWGYCSETSQTDVDDTSRCMEFLRAVDPGRYQGVLRRAESYLVGMAGPDGGFPTYVRGNPADVDMTAGAVIALSPHWTQHAELLDASVRYLLDHGQGDGTYERGWSLSESSVINRVLDALSRVPEPGGRVEQAIRTSVQRLCTTQNGDGGWGQGPGADSDVLSTAQAVPVVVRHGPQPVADRAARWLLGQQHDHSGFTSIPDQAGPRPLPYDFPVLADVHALLALNAADARHAAGTSGPSGDHAGGTGAEVRQLPAFYCPFPPALHPLAAAADARSLAWMHEHQLCTDDGERTRMAQTGCGQLAGRMSPSARADLLQIFSDYTLWAFAFDDEYCDEGPLGERPGELADAAVRILRCAEVPETPVYADDRYGIALRDLRSRLDAASSPVHGARFVEAMRGYLLTEVRKAGFVARGQRPGLDDYTLVRLYSGGSIVFAELVAVCNGCPPPPHLADDRRVRAITEVAATLVDWETDVISHGKETERTGDGFNLIDAVRQEFGCGEDEAVERAITMWDRIMTLFLRLRARLTAELPELTAYVAGLAQYIRGVLDWSLGTDRYVYLDGRGGRRAFRPGGWRDTPRDNSPEPLPIPSVAWWWQHDPGTSTAPAPAAAHRFVLPTGPSGLGAAAARIPQLIKAGPRQGL
ncbi:prenyltransferase/squalene oxidase repeat-containing protein [Streptomyces sp. NPDC048483]|uniref:terpene synthase family protein n=1 Tax=Streptomyces sp. NPDC048483 TaxID=3154927 RepID=UPI00342E58BC